jgi:hypothetical protein
MENNTLAESIAKEISKSLEEKANQEKEKKWRLPFGKKVGKSQKKKGYVTLVKLHTNMCVEFKKVRIEDQTLMEDDIPRLATAGYVFYHKKNPYIFLPEWNVEPFTPFSARDDFKLSIENGTNTAGFSLLLARMLKTQVSNQKQMGGWLKWVIGLILVGIIAYAFISGGGK